MYDSIRNERIRMRTADLTLRYQQDSTLMAHKVLFQKQENEMLILRQTRLVTLAVAVIALLIAAFLYLYNRKKRDLLLAQNRRTVSTLRLENIRNRLSPHFIFNVLNQEVVNRKDQYTYYLFHHNLFFSLTPILHYLYNSHNLKR